MELISSVVEDEAYRSPDRRRNPYALCFPTLGEVWPPRAACAVADFPDVDLAAFHYDDLPLESALRAWSAATSRILR